MASKRKLKKTMHSITSELVAEVFFKSLVSKEDITADANNLVVEIVEFSREYINRINRGGGADNPKEVKKYYKKLYSDWNNGVGKIIDSIEKL